jgi:hypothetical protein
MQRIAPVDQHAIEDAVLSGDLLVQLGVAIDVAHRRGIGAQVLRAQRREVSFIAGLVDMFEAGLAVTIERRATEIPLE